MSSRQQQFVSRTAEVHPADPLSHRNSAKFSDCELRLCGAHALGEPIKITLSNRRKRFRTVIGSTTFALSSLNLPETGKSDFHCTLLLHTSLSSSLNLKILLCIQLFDIDNWLKIKPHLTYYESLPKGSTVELQSNSVNSKENTPLSISITGEESDDSSVLVRRSISTRSDESGTLGAFKESRSRSSSISRSELPFTLYSDTVGIVFIEIVSVANLPKFRTLTGISFDMDPFVVMSFGRKVYKTPHRRHTLNPTFNCKVAFEVMPNERQFSVIFAVWDMDRITLNDKVAESKIPVSQIMQRYAPKCDPYTGLYDLDNFVPSVIVVPLEHVAGTAEMVIKAHYYPDAAIRQQMWRGVIGLYLGGNTTRTITQRSLKGTLASKIKMKSKHDDQVSPTSTPLLGTITPASPNEGLDFNQLKALLNSLGSTLTEENIRQFFFYNNDLDPETSIVSEDQVVLELEDIARRSSSRERIIYFRICPICHQKSDKLGQHALHHLALCASRQWAESNSVMLDSTYVSSAQASKRWYANFLSKFSYGSYKLGAHSANILVQDRTSGQISEEKIATSVRIGIRMIYALGPVERKKFQNLLRRYTLKQGIKYSSFESANHIEPFIKYHNLDMSEVLLPVSSFKTFNDFFYRELKPGTRPCENPKESRTAVSCADCRLTIFPSVSNATDLWIKGKNFSIKRLLGDTYPEDVYRYTELGSTVAVFRLAPQDYHRVHSPVDGIMGRPKHIDGNYYTVNPMAVRSTLDVFGENSRTVFPIQSAAFGKVMVVMVGAMMVGSCIVTAQPGKLVRRTDELGYFRFGGSTVVLLFERQKMIPDSDLLANSQLKIETLVKVGMSVGHTPGIPEFVRTYDTRHTTIRRAKSLISGGGAYLPFALD